MLNSEFLSGQVYNLIGFQSIWEIKIKKKVSLRFNLIGQPGIKGNSVGFMYG